MKAGIIGLPLVGKRTLLQLLTGNPGPADEVQDGNVVNLRFAV